MAKGGFDRRVRVEDGKVVDHRPVDHEDALGWHIVHVPKDIPATLNELISTQSLRLEKGELTWDEDWKKKKKEEKDEITKLKKRIEVLEKKLATAPTT